MLKNNKIVLFVTLKSWSDPTSYVTWRGNAYELPEDDKIVSKHVGAW